jgi:hypothetical protein
MFSLFDSSNPADPTDPHRGMRGAANISGNIFVIVFVLVNSVLAGLAAILGGPLLLAFTKFVDWDTDLRLGKAWSTAFIAYAGYFCVSTLMGIDGDAPPTTDSMLAPEMLIHIAFVQGPPVLLAAALLVWRLPAYRSVIGFLRAVFFVCASLLISAMMMYFAVERFTSPGVPGMDFGEGLAMIGVIMLAIVVPGSIVASLVVWLSTRLGPRPETPLRFGSIYWTATLMLLAWVASVVVFESVFLTSEAMFSWYKAYSVAPDPQQYALVNGVELRVAMRIAAGILVMSLLIAGSVLNSRLASIFQGRIGWLRAVLTTGVAVVGALAPITVLLLWAYAVGGFDDMDMYW